MQTRSQTRQNFQRSLRTRNQTRLHQCPPIQVLTTHRITRSQTRTPGKLPAGRSKKCEENGVDVHRELSAIGCGLHGHWEYPVEKTSNTPGVVLGVPNPSYSSLFEGSISSISSDESSYGSGSFSSIHSEPPHSDFTFPQTPTPEFNHNRRPLFAPSPTRSHKAQRPPRPLQRASAHQWGSEQSAESSSDGIVSDPSNPTSIFTQQLAKMVNQRRVLEHVEMEFEADFGSDAASVADTEMDLQSQCDDSDQPMRSSNGSQAGLAARLGPCGTELIEKVPPSDQTIDYPSTWASRRSTHLTIFPTVQDFGIDGTRIESNR